MSFIEYLIVPKIRQYWYDVIEYKQVLTQELIEFLFKLFYHLPHLDIVDREDLSYFVRVHTPNEGLSPKPLGLLTNRIEYWNRILND